MSNLSLNASVLSVAVFTIWVYGISVPLVITIAPAVLLSISLLALVICFFIVFWTMRLESFRDRKNLIIMLIGLTIVYSSWLASVLSIPDPFAPVPFWKQAVVGSAIMVGSFFSVVNGYYSVSQDYKVAKFLFCGGFLTVTITQSIFILTGGWTSLLSIFISIMAICVGFVFMLAGNIYGFVLYNRKHRQEVDEINTSPKCIIV